MPHTDPFYPWLDRVQRLFSDLKPHHRKALAEYSFGMAAAQCSGLTSVVRHLAAFFVVGTHAIQQRLRELYRPADAQAGCDRSEFDYTLCFGPLLRWAAGSQADKRLVLALDPTNLTDRFRVLCVAVLYRGNALPVAWAVQTARQKGSWNDVWIDLLGRLRKELGDDWTVLVLTDRGLESPELFRVVVSLGRHPLMRVKAGGKFQPQGWHAGHFMDRFAASVGRRWAGSGIAYPKGSRLACTLLAAWDEGHDEPWLILTDLPKSGANPAWYAWRMWIEQGFRAIKRGQWQWHRTRMADPLRVARLWAVMATATIWMIEIGGVGLPAELPQVPRAISVLKEGLLTFWATLVHGLPLPSGEILHHPWPKIHWQSDPLTESTIDGC